jgi:catechol 2,3-dioxygenase-like lactoylglutathione lyase family enzyme
MTEAHLEHANITVSDPDAAAAILCNIFDWKIRWAGAAMDKGYTVHVGGEDSYLAIYTNDNIRASDTTDVQTVRNLNHIGIVVDDLSAIEAKVLAAGCQPHNHRHYDPGSSFYFHTFDDLEIEVVSYN